MNTLSQDELAGVVAHELAHIKNRDTLIASIAATLSGVIVTVADMARWSMMFGGYNRYNRSRDSSQSNNALAAVGGLLLVILAPIAATLIQLAISRSREYLADERGARILGNPLPLAEALEKIEYAARQITMPVNAATAPLYIVNPLKGGGLSALFSTHPPTAERVARLRAMARA
jgi:heat shock protein HtpX